MKAFPAFAEMRAQDCKLLLDGLVQPLRQVLKFSESGDASDLTVTKGSRGTVGLPRLLYELKESHKAKP
jgi:hypothetical protein